MSDDIRITEIQGSLLLAQERKNLRIAEEYLSALNAKNIHAIGQTLHPDLHFVGPSGEIHKRDDFLDTFDKLFPNLEKITVTSVRQSNDLIYYTYNMIFPPPMVPLHANMKMTHEENGLIKKIEMIYDTALLQNYLHPQK
jgi:hypothetical protein